MPRSHIAARAGCRQSLWGGAACQEIIQFWEAMLPGQVVATQQSLSEAWPSWKTMRSLPEHIAWQQPGSACAAVTSLHIHIGPQCLQAEASLCPALQASSTCSTLGTQRHWSRPRSCEYCLTRVSDLMQPAA